MKSLLFHMVLYIPCTTNSKRQRSATILAVLSCLLIYRGTLQIFVMLLCGPLRYLVIPQTGNRCLLTNPSHTSTAAIQNNIIPDITQLA